MTTTQTAITTATKSATTTKTTYDRDKPTKSSRDKKIRIRIADKIYNNNHSNNNNNNNNNNNTNNNISNNNNSYGKCKNDKNWENWEKLREQKLEKMKSICFESYRQSKLDWKMRHKQKPQSLDPSWYTDNIYSNRSIDLDDDYIPDCLRYGTTCRKLRDINENDEEFDDDGYVLQRSKSCKEFKYPKSRSCCFGGYETKSTNPSVPKSYSFSISRTKTKPFDVIDYEPPPSRKEKKMMRKAVAAAAANAAAADYYCHDSHSHSRCCARDRCTSSKCLLEEIYNYNRSRSNRDRRPYPFRRAMVAEWEEKNRMGSRPTRYISGSGGGSGGGGGGGVGGSSCDEYCYRRSNLKKKSRYSGYPHDGSSHFDCYDDGCDGHHFLRKSDLHEIDVNHFIHDERSRLMLQDKFLDEDEIYLKTSEYHPHHPSKSKSMLEVKPPSKYDEDTCSDSTEMDLEDFNFDFEKYWEELEKPPSPIDLDMQQRNMNKNMKVKNVNVGFYNNGTPIDDHHREQERLMIKKSLLEGMPSPPQNNDNDDDDDDNGSNFHYYDQTGSPFHRYSHKVYPESTPTYKYNNFYPHDNLHANNSNNTNPISLINNIFSIYKPNKYSPLNCQQLNDHHKPEPCKKMNVPSTIRPLGAPYSEYMASMKRPLIVSTEQPHFKIIPEKTGLKISPLYRFDTNDKKKHKLKSTSRPLLFPH